MNLPDKKIQLSNRRGFLRGLGTSIALPALASFAPPILAEESVSARRLAVTKSGAPLRTAFVYFPNGVIQDTWWPDLQGPDFRLSRTLAPLNQLRNQIQVLGGLDHVNAEAGRDGAGDHARGNGVFLTGVRLNKSATAIRAGVSIDQEMAKHVGHLTRFSSLELSCEPARTTGSCDSGYSCAYTYNLSWSSAKTPKAAESNPRLLFERLFGAGSREQRLTSLRQRREQQRSILDFVIEDARQVERKLDSTDRCKLDEYLTSVRAIENRIEKAESLGNPPECESDPPAGIPRDFAEYVTVMFEMLLLSFQTDSTRIATLMLAHDGSNRPFNHIGISEGHHELSHHRNDEEKIRKIAEIDLWYVQQFSNFLQRLSQTQDVDGKSLLDNSMIVYGSGNSDGNSHTHRNLPILLAGGGGGALSPGQFVYHNSQPMCNLYLSLTERMGIASLPRFGDSTGLLANL